MIRTYSTPHSYNAVALDDEDADRLRASGLWLRGSQGPFSQEPDDMPLPYAPLLGSGGVAAAMFGGEVEGITAYRVGVTDPTPTDCQAERFLFGREEW